MAARKLQTEIDRTLKKVTEGVELFESIYEKMQASTNMTQKEKLETDLKTQIKKLQRLRDQIKTWVASNDIKDKSLLLDNRKLIEMQMEKFKACEKEMKTKAFSKEGLIQASKLDPKAQEKLEATQWLQSTVEELLMQVEQAEAEIETLQGGVKKKNKGSATTGRLEELDHLNERRKWHISRLEIVLRLLDNGSLSTERVQELKEDVIYFVESNTEEEFDEDEGIYDELNLDEEEEKFGLVADEDESDSGSDVDSDDAPLRTPGKKHDDESVSSKREEQSPILKKASVTLQLRKASIAEAKPPVPPPNPNFAAQPMASILKNGLPPAPRLPAILPVRYAAAAAAAVTTPPTAPSSTMTITQTTVHHHPSPALQSPVVPLAAALPTPPTSSPFPTSFPSQDQSSAATSSPSLTHPSVSAASPMLSSASASGPQMEDSINSTSQSPALSEAISGSVGAPLATSSPQRKLSINASLESSSPVIVDATMIEMSPFSAPQSNAAVQLATVGQTLTQQVSPLPQQVQQVPTSHTHALPDASPLPSASQQSQYPPGMKLPISAEQFAMDQDAALKNASPAPPMQQQPPQFSQQVPTQRGPQTNISSFPGSLSDLVASFENVKQKAPHRMTNLDQVHKLLDSGYSNMPQPQDTEKPKYYVPRNPYQTPQYYPQTLNPVLGSPALFAQLDIETLFYVFYYLPGTYQQYLAAKELKRQSWRFHVKYLTWFQRHSEPQAITEEYEQGVYVYFDWEGSWCQRKKSDFRFEYRYLSED